MLSSGLVGGLIFGLVLGGTHRGQSRPFRETLPSVVMPLGAGTRHLGSGPC
jgi:hypothetical protein